jgi:serine protease Do
MGFLYVKGEVPKKVSNQSKLYIQANESTSGMAAHVSLELKEIIRNVQKLVVKIELPDGSIGSGFVYNNKGDVITNAHVAANVKEVKVKTVDAKEFSGTVIGISTKTDIALVRVEGLVGVEPLKMATHKVDVGDEVLALGNPLGLDNTVTTGIISGISRDFNIEPFHYENVYQISAPITNGNSGGPLIDGKSGEVIGVNSAGINEGTIGFSIPIQSVLTLVEGWSKSPMTSLPEIDMGNMETGNHKAVSDSELAKYLIQYFYESINYEDYVTAYSLLGNTWQRNTSYQVFRDGYLNTKSVAIDEFNTKQNGTKINAVGVISAIEYMNDGGDTTLRKYLVKYEIGYENGQIKLLSGSGKLID